ncbi:nitrilase-related carbon-nitrogen hydrolase [Labrys sp. 22185]|uniref:nitrilase-related carbon-nitrogen hydrolase n=1 Tax=Labrys sp. 22185 TaxID=3453888 RepID=UPI003F861FC3
MVSYTSTFKAAAVQAEPVWLDADATIEKAIKIMDEAASNGAQLIAFPEVFIPGYPFWAWMGDQKWGLKFLLKYHENSLELGDERMRRAPCWAGFGATSSARSPARAMSGRPCALPSPIRSPWPGG